METAAIRSSCPLALKRVSNRSALLVQKLCHCLREGRTLNGFHFSKPKFSLKQWFSTWSTESSINP